MFAFTQGTTNNPKGHSIFISYSHSLISSSGVVLLHKNLALATQSNLYGLELPDHAILLSYLPLAHIYEVL